MLDVQVPPSHRGAQHLVATGQRAQFRVTACIRAMRDHDTLTRITHQGARSVDMGKKKSRVAQGHIASEHLPRQRATDSGHLQLRPCLGMKAVGRAATTPPIHELIGRIQVPRPDILPDQTIVETTPDDAIQHAPVSTHLIGMEQAAV
ncbi:hypothetical protein D8I35_15340 [Corticibacter populi]|uniref:Uncharacterized protein n=1 Tax=Corticibacter populi TaxID=1550736 RepID=A0A3M6QM57_9BURK|nr:hypothetical protein D8I35_15340 [Corticibacter populi]